MFESTQKCKMHSNCKRHHTCRPACYMCHICKILYWWKNKKHKTQWFYNRAADLKGRKDSVYLQKWYKRYDRTAHWQNICFAQKRSQDYTSTSPAGKVMKYSSPISWRAVVSPCMQHWARLTNFMPQHKEALYGHMIKSLVKISLF